MHSSPLPDNSETASGDAWLHLRRHTPAWIALGRTGGSITTRELLSFSLGHALARDAVYTPFEPERIAEALAGHFTEILHLESKAADRRTILARPDLGRMLSERSIAAVGETKPVDLAIMVSDGLSALAAHVQVAPLLKQLVPRLRTEGVTISPLCLVRFGRVALQDELGALLKAKLILTLIGERPGIGTPDSLGAYFVNGPKRGNTDAQRNCVSNIRTDGLRPEAAALKLTGLLTRSLRQGFSGALFKDSDSDAKKELPCRPAAPQELQ